MARYAPPRERRVRSDEFAYADEERFEVLKPLVTVQIDGKPHQWHLNMCRECNVSPDRAPQWCCNEQLRKMFGYQPRPTLVVPKSVVDATRLWALDRHSLVREAKHIHIATEGRTDVELRRAIYRARAWNHVPVPM
jgi:hypothetical protein